MELAVDYELVRLTAQEVDILNVFQVRMEEFKIAIEILSKGQMVIDGNKKPENTAVKTDMLIKADAILPGISILCKYYS